MCAKVGKELNINPRNVLIASTGIIGRQLPIKKIHRRRNKSRRAVEQQSEGRAGLCRGDNDNRYEVQTGCAQTRNIRPKSNDSSHGQGSRYDCTEHGHNN